MRLGALIGSLAAVTACGGGEDDGAEKSRPSKSATAPAAGIVAPARIEVIAGLAGCKAEIRIDADELREGLCHSDKADYRITTFPEEKLKEAWLEEASVYGGKYLVGPRWVVATKPEHLEGARSKLGGTIRQLSGTS
ncbi:hypothetical protein [Streptomyces sp. SID13726]|uniref:hypothetical protein n=1 Tax=Streptomyces sp. SID13726 TaxID=2706058 RepID=UPI0013BC1670|nr:hypothetical protein [Streptomyces sp. SID13726]NEB04025.1 hypothetical protein [Streptomyces sp. SID13726]